jgi:hypothetical protein
MWQETQAIRTFLDDLYPLLESSITAGSTRGMLKRELDLQELCQPSMAGKVVSVASVQLERISLHKSVS